MVRVDEYASGVAVVRAHGWVDLNALETGVVVAVNAEPGRTVEAGDILVRLEDGMERAELKRVQREIDLLVADRLRTRTPPGESSELNVLTSELRIAEHRLAARAVRARSAPSQWRTRASSRPHGIQRAAQRSFLAKNSSVRSQASLAAASS